MQKVKQRKKKLFFFYSPHFNWNFYQQARQHFRGHCIAVSSFRVFFLVHKKTFFSLCFISENFQSDDERWLMYEKDMNGILLYFITMLISWIFSISCLTNLQNMQHKNETNKGNVRWKMTKKLNDWYMDELQAVHIFVKRF